MDSDLDKDFICTIFCSVLSDQRVSLSSSEVNAITQCLVAKQYERGESIIHQDKVCDYIAILQKGIVRFYYYKDDGTEVTQCFHFPGSFMSAYSSFLSGTPSFENAQALTNTEVLLLQKSDLNRLYLSYPNIEKVGKIITEKMYMELEQRIMSLQCNSAEERYRNLLQNETPEIIKNIPLKHIASYLGVTAETLSRIRRKISN